MDLLEQRRRGAIGGIEGRTVLMTPEELDGILQSDG
jgi:hypothetical protein